MNNVPQKVIVPGQVLRLNCAVTSHYGFSAPSTLTCGQFVGPRPDNMLSSVTPGGPLACDFSPSTVTPPVDGSVRTTLTVRVPPDVEYGSYDYGFDVQSPGAQEFTPGAWPLNLVVEHPPTVERPYFTVDCGNRVLSVLVGGGYSDLACLVSVPPDFGGGLVIDLGALQPYSEHVHYQTNIREINVGPAGGTAEFRVMATATHGDAVGSYTLYLRVRNQDGATRHVFFDLQVEITERVYS
jgi:hypothetical protein